MRHFLPGLTAVAILAPLTVAAQNYIPARNYNGPGVVVNMDVIGASQPSGDTFLPSPPMPPMAPIPVYSAPLPPPIAMTPPLPPSLPPVQAPVQEIAALPPVSSPPAPMPTPTTTTTTTTTTQSAMPKPVAPLPVPPPAPAPMPAPPPTVPMTMPAPAPNHGYQSVDVLPKTMPSMMQPPAMPDPALLGIHENPVPAKIFPAKPVSVKPVTPVIAAPMVKDDLVSIAPSRHYVSGVMNEENIDKTLSTSLADDLDTTPPLPSKSGEMASSLRQHTTEQMPTVSQPIASAKAMPLPAPSSDFIVKDGGDLPPPLNLQPNNYSMDVPPPIDKFAVDHPMDMDAPLPTPYADDDNNLPLPVKGKAHHSADVLPPVMPAPLMPQHGSTMDILPPPVRKSAADKPLDMNAPLPSPYNDDLPLPIKQNAHHASDVLPPVMPAPIVPPPPPLKTAMLTPEKPMPVASPVKDDFEAYRLLFDGGADTLKDSEKHVLDKIIGKMNNDPALHVQIHAYADGTPDNSAKARRLSLTRAMNVRSYLLDKGISATRLDVRAMGMGSTAMGDNISNGKAPADRVDVIFARG